MKKIYVILAVLSLNACGQQSGGDRKDASIPYTPAFTAPADWKTLAQDNYSIQYPSNWDIYSPPPANTLFDILAPMATDTDKFRVNINLVTEDLTGKNVADLAAYSKASIEQVKAAMPGMIMNEDKDLKVGDIVYHEISYSVDQQGFKMQLEQWFRIADNKAYVLTLAALQTQYSGIKQLGENVLSTFKLK